MKFYKKFNQYVKMFLENTIPQEHLPIHQGDQVVFRSDWAKNPLVQDIVKSSTGERIREMIEQKKDPLVVTSINSRIPAAYGSHGSFRDNGNVNEGDYMVVVGQQYALGLYKNIVTVPMAVLERVDNGINLTPLSQNQNDKERKQNYKGEEPKIDKTLSDPTSQTHASWKDKGGPLPS